MALEKAVIKADLAERQTFEYKPREIAKETAAAARSFVETDKYKSPDFKISELIAQQAGITHLENEAVKDQINAQVLAKLKAAQEAAYKEGHELGLIEGTDKAYKDSKDDLLKRLKSLDDAFKSMEDLKTRLLVENEAELINLVFLTAKKIAMRDLEENRDAVAEILRGVTAELQTDERITVRLNSEDMYFIETLQDKAGERLQNYERVKFIVDDTIQAGGCLIESSYGTVDASVAERVERTWQTLESRIPRVQQAKKE